jgi:hypothetical protein
MVKNDRLESCKDYGSVNEECKPERTISMQNRASTSSSSFKEEKLPNSIDVFENGYDSQITAILEVKPVHHIMFAMFSLHQFMYSKSTVKSVIIVPCVMASCSSLPVVFFCF